MTFRSREDGRQVIVSPDFIFRVSFIAVFSFLTVLRLYYRISTGAIHDHGLTRREGLLPVALRWTLGVPLLAATGLYIFAPETWLWMSVSLHPILRSFGTAIGFAAVVMIRQVHRALGRNFSSTLVIRREHTLITTGPYRFVRHPMYSAYLLLFFGALLISANWVIGVTGVAVIVTLMTVRLGREEALLLEKFGAEYEQYRRVTGMFIPLTHKISAIGKTSRDIA